MIRNVINLSIDDLQVGAMCSEAIVDDGNVLLLGGNTRITTQVLSKLRERGIESVKVSASDLAALTGKPKRTKQENCRAKSKPDLATTPVKDLLVDRFEEELSDERGEIIGGLQKAAARKIESVRSQLNQETLRSVSSLVSVSSDFASSMIDDHDHTVGMVCRPEMDEDLSERSTRVSVLGMSIAVELGLNGRQIKEVGLTGILHDIGLMLMDRTLRQPIERMTEDQRWEYKKHPLFASRQIESMLEVPHCVSLAIQQVHEQFDGSGFPRGVSGSRIHTYARILNVSEAYLQLISPHQQRPAVVPHDALGFLLHQAARGVFDPKVIRALLNAESLFPLSSQVELDDGEAATVIRRSRSGYHCPVLIDGDGNRIELENSSRTIIRPIIELPGSQVRMTQELMTEISWNPSEATAVV